MTLMTSMTMPRLGGLHYEFANLDRGGSEGKIQ
jgi:hypothetical protein